MRDICTRSVVVELKLSKNYCPSKIFARLRLNHCIVGRALKKVGSLRIGQNDHLGPHFPKSELFQMKNIWKQYLILLFSLELGWFWSPKRTTFPIWQSLRACFLIISIFSLWYNQLFQITIEETKFKTHRGERSIEVQPMWLYILSNRADNSKGGHRLIFLF